MDKKLGQLIRSKRKKANMTQLELSIKLGYDSVQFVSLFERGLSKVPMNVLGKCFVIFKVKENEQRRIINDLCKSYLTKITNEIGQGCDVQRGLK